MSVLCVLTVIVSMTFRARPHFSFTRLRTTDFVPQNTLYYTNSTALCLGRRTIVRGAWIHHVLTR